MIIRFVIPGEPQGKGRPKFSRQGSFVKPTRLRRRKTMRRISRRALWPPALA